MSSVGEQTGIMQTRVGPVALSCLKIAGAGSLLAVPLGQVSLAAGEATYVGSLATMLIAGAVARAADRREMARATLAARRVLARVKVGGRQDAATTIAVCGGSVVVVRDGAQISG